MDGISIGSGNLELILDGSEKPNKLEFSVLRRITENFSYERLIGEGGCAHVYKGILPSGRIVAVKKLLNAKTVDERMFEREVTTMMSVKHQNIVRFLGYCSYTEQRALQVGEKHILADERERLLCFDYMRNGSLADYVTDELRGLQWHTRFQIIKGICEGLQYLHQEEAIIHMDLKPANILLDADLVPKISDFGISRPGEITKTLSKERFGSLGYCDPEYLSTGKLSLKTDIYSLGVIITEMLTGSRKDDPDASMVKDWLISPFHSPSLVTTEQIQNYLCKDTAWFPVVHRRWRHRWKKSAKHTILGYHQQVTKCLELAQKCRHINPIDRPNITDIIRELNEMYSIDRHISEATKSTVEKRNSFSEHMIGIEPLKLQFSVGLHKKISRLIQLINDTDDYIAYRVSITSHLPYCISPNQDVVPPGSIYSVTITLEALEKPLQAEEHRIDDLCVKSTQVDKSLTAKDITGHMFKEEPGRVVDTVNLRVSVHAPKQLLVVEPLELRLPPPGEPNKLFPCSVQLTNSTGDYVAFTFVLPQDKKVLYSLALDTGILPPWSTRGVVMNLLVQEEEPAGIQHCKHTAVVQNVVLADNYLSDDDISVNMFSEQADVQEEEVDIVLVQRPLPKSPTSVHSAMLQSREDDETALLSTFCLKTQLLQIYPSELRFACEDGAEYISLVNKNDYVVYFLAYYDDEEYCINYGITSRGAVAPKSTLAVRVFPCKKPYGGGAHRWNLFRIMMLSASGNAHAQLAVDALDMGATIYYDREAMMNRVRAEGGKAHEALLASVVHAPHPESVATKQNEEMYMLEDGIGLVKHMDVHPAEPWVATGHACGHVCVWKMDPQTSMYEKMLSTPDSKESITSVKFIARMKWVASGNYGGYIIVYTYVDRMTEIKKLRVDRKVKFVNLAVHPTLPYLLSSAGECLIKLWDWEQGWICTREFSRYSADIGYTWQLNFNPKDAKTFATLDCCNIKIWSMNSEEPGTCLPGKTQKTCFAYCTPGSHRQYMGAVDERGKIEILDLWSKAHVHQLNTRLEHGTWFMACHPRRPLLAAANSDGGVIVWNYTTYGVEKVLIMEDKIKGIGFIDIESFQRLVIAHADKIEMVDILYGPALTSRTWDSLFV